MARFGTDDSDDRQGGPGDINPEASRVAGRTGSAYNQFTHQVSEYAKLLLVRLELLKPGQGLEGGYQIILTLWRQHRDDFSALFDPFLPGDRDARVQRWVDDHWADMALFIEREFRSWRERHPLVSRSRRRIGVSAPRGLIATMPLNDEAAPVHQSQISRAHENRFPEHSYGCREDECRGEPDHPHDPPGRASPVPSPVQLGIRGQPTDTRQGPQVTPVSGRADRLIRRPSSLRTAHGPGPSTGAQGGQSEARHECERILDDLDDEATERAVVLLRRLWVATWGRGGQGGGDIRDDEQSAGGDWGRLPAVMNKWKWAAVMPLRVK